MNRKIEKRKRRSGHRSWAPRNAPIPGGHQGDIMSPEKRSSLMSRIGSMNTSPERAIMERLQATGMCFERHVQDLPGRPDIVLRSVEMAVFIDGDFWHGWRFPLWKEKLSQQWQEKIGATRARDQRNYRKLRNKGWKVLRLWEHQIENNPEKCIARILNTYKKRLRK